MFKQELPWPNDVARLYSRIRHLRWPFWLDSGEGPVGPGRRWHILVADPRWRILGEKGRTRLIDRQGKQRELFANPLEVIREKLREGKRTPSDLPFTGGALGCLSYDFGCRLEGIPVEKHGFPELAMGIFDWAILLDRRERRCWLAGEAIPPDLPGMLEEAARGKEEVSAGHWSSGRPLALISREEYERAFRRIRHYLREGECYQVNYAQPFEVACRGDTFALYLAMREQNPSPYGAYLPFPFGHVLSSSPEQFLQLRHGRVTTRPIKGTRPRGRTAEEDRRLTRELQQSEKDRAENVMIVDLLRNDLGKVCEPGSIEVPALFQVKKFPTVLHLVSTVRGRLGGEEDALSLLQSCFPGGSITGAPKHRAMQIIQELEGRFREVYCGSIGWIGYDGNMDTNIAIRTLLVRDGRATYWAGGGIVIDSRLEEEYQESLDKSAAFFRLFAPAGEREP
ncbi:MAG TPA: aminodeoxychorismate synthase component I [Chromatiaceae bacterium]|nr:aminodeoxychorismate synthase component I [Chromatiaceae bacterium]